MRLTRPGAAQTWTSSSCSRAVSARGSVASAPNAVAKTARARPAPSSSDHERTHPRAALDGAKLLEPRRDPLGGRVADPRAHARLRAGEVLELARRAQDGEDLEVEPGEGHVVRAAVRDGAALVRRGLVPRGDVRERDVVAVGRLEEAVEAAQELEVGGGEVVALGVGERGEVGHVAPRGEVDLDGPARGERHVRDPVLGLEHDAAPVRELGVEDVAQQVAARAAVVLARLVEQRAGARRDVRVAVDLPVRVVQRDADLLPAVLEAEDLLDAGLCPERGGAVGPRVDDRADALRRERAERRAVVAREAHDLAPARGRCVELERRVRDDGVGHAGHALERREAVLEDDDVVVGVGDLAVRVGGAGTRGAQRARVGRGEERAVHPVRGERDPVAREGVAAHLGADVRARGPVGAGHRGEPVGQRPRVVEPT